MFIDRLINQGNMPLLEKSVKFSEARHDLLAEDIVNLSTPNYRQKDLSVDRFQQMLSEQVEHPETPDESLDKLSSDDDLSKSQLLFHDRNNRSVEQLMSDQAQNALMHNLMTELLRKQFSEIQEAIKERPT
ncbi:MAG: hypothetical protein ACTHM6_16740 [Tepidisphaeraceae bacterium]